MCVAAVVASVVGRCSCWLIKKKNGYVKLTQATDHNIKTHQTTFHLNEKSRRDLISREPAIKDLVQPLMFMY